MTEDEARQKWCPSVRWNVTADKANSLLMPFQRWNNRGWYTEQDQDDPWVTKLDSDDNPCCIASDCMAWRWEDGPMDDELHGYCGLAGKS